MFTRPPLVGIGDIIATPIIGWSHEVWPPDGTKGNVLELTLTIPNVRNLGLYTYELISSEFNTLPIRTNISSTLDPSCYIANEIPFPIQSLSTLPSTVPGTIIKHAFRSDYHNTPVGGGYWPYPVIISPGGSGYDYYFYFRFYYAGQISPLSQAVYYNTNTSTVTII